MLKRYLVVDNSVWKEDSETYFDRLDDAKDFAKDLAKKGHSTVVYETLYEFDPDDMKEEEVPTGDLPNDQLPWAWIN